MDHRDHVELIRAGIAPTSGAWADLGSGRGAFTLALAELLEPGAVIHSVDRDRAALEDQRRSMAALFPSVDVRYHVGDFGRLDDAQLGGLRDLDGVVMANSLHFARDRVAVLRALLGRLKTGGTFFLVEYDADRGNPWVPFPLSFRTWQDVGSSVGLDGIRLVGRVPSRFLGSIYAAASTKLAP